MATPWVQWVWGFSNEKQNQWASSRLILPLQKYRRVMRTYHCRRNLYGLGYVKENISQNQDKIIALKNEC
jgi:hypothetical protein